MADEFIQIKVEGLDKLQEALRKFPRQVGKYLGGAGKETAKRVILPTEGLQKYPPATAANFPPTPYYIRGRGTQYKSHNTLTSERLGTQWYERTTLQNYQTEVGNRSSYAKFVHGQEQARFMAPKGWRKLLEVAREKIVDIERTYNSWINRLLQDLKLK